MFGVRGVEYVCENKMNMEKQYKEIEVWAGGSIYSAIKELSIYKAKGELALIVFNGQNLYSDIDDLDSAYKKITGKTKAECDEAQQKWHDEYEEEKRKHKEAIPELTKEWIEKGNKILDEQYRDLWAKCVPIRLGDLYRGMELGNCLDIVLELNNGCELELAKEIIDNQGHSGMSYGLVRSMVKSFCNRGAEFSEFVK